MYILCINIYIPLNDLNVFDGKDTSARLTISYRTETKWGHPTRHVSFGQIGPVKDIKFHHIF